MAGSFTRESFEIRRVPVYYLLLHFYSRLDGVGFTGCK